ncbi:vWA domain-containing protein [Acetivibrio straminisolvens]|jgi:hypothetical protein|uniref:vWA domain-containing protein n=1 Tax=Acetivibrio straminisolvens TaxID=253314 RepID=UPI002240D461|nr:vWA domain-containing protein [Acetivibrio straminisolvens]
MKKRALKKSFAILIAIGVFLNLAFLQVNNVWADDLMDFYYTNSVTPLKNPMGLFEPSEIKFSHDGSIEVSSVPSKKEAIVLFDSSYESTETPIPFLGIFEHALFSRSIATYQGQNITINGDVFTRDKIMVDTASVNVEGKNKYYEREGSWKGTIGTSEIKLVDEAKPREELSKNDRKYYDYLFEEDGEITNMINVLTSAIEDEIDVNKYGAQIQFKEENKHLYSWPYKSEEDIKNGNDIYIQYTNKNSGAPYSELSYKNIEYMILGSGIFKIKSNMYFEGDLIISVQGGIFSELNDTPKFIYAEGNITLQGGQLNGRAIENLYLISGNGNISIETGTSDFKGFAIAPNGSIRLNGQNCEITGSFIGKELIIPPSNVIFNRPTEDMTDPFKRFIKETKGFDAVKEAISYLPNLFDSYTRAGVITYSDYADVNELDIIGIDEDDPETTNWKLYDVSTEIDDLRSYISTLKADVTTKRSNLGDAIRKALGIFKSDICDPDAEKFLIVFTSLDPNAYTIVSGTDNFELDLYKDINEDQVSDESGNKGNMYVEELCSMIDEYNSSTDGGKIYKIFIDLSLFRQEANDNEEIIDPLYDLAENLNIDTSDSVYYYRPSKEEMKNYHLSSSFINKLAQFSNNMPPKLAVKNLKISSAKFELSVPDYLKPVELFFKKTDGTKESIANLSGLAPSSDGKYNISYTFSGNALATLTSIDGGLSYGLESNELYLTLIVNYSEVFDETTLAIKGTVDTAGPVITYTLYEDKDMNGTKSGDEDEFEITVPFDNIKFNVEYKKDIN